MAKDPPFGLDPHTAVRDPDSLPPLMISAMYDVMERGKVGGTLAERFISAFNIAAWSLTTAGRRKTKHGGWHGEGSEARLKRGTLDLTPIIGMQKNTEAYRAPGYDKKKAEIKDYAEKLMESRPDYYGKSWKDAHGG